MSDKTLCDVCKKVHDVRLVCPEMNKSQELHCGGSKKLQILMDGMPLCTTPCDGCPDCQPAKKPEAASEQLAVPEPVLNGKEKVLKHSDFINN
jgi:hypothetical protein